MARNADFQDLARNIARLAVETGTTDVEALKAVAYPGGGTLSDAIANAIATIGENMTLRRAASVQIGQGFIGQYVHNAIAEGLGKIGVLVALEFESGSGKAGATRTLDRSACRGGKSARPRSLGS